MNHKLHEYEYSISRPHMDYKLHEYYHMNHKLHEYLFAHGYEQ